MLKLLYTDVCDFNTLVKLHHTFNKLHELAQRSHVTPELLSSYTSAIVALQNEYKLLQKRCRATINLEHIKFNIATLDTLLQSVTDQHTCVNTEKLKDETKSLKNEEELVDIMIEKEKIKTRTLEKKQKLLDLINKNSADSAKLDTQLVTAFEFDEVEKAKFIKAVCERVLDDTKLKTDLVEATKTNKPNVESSTNDDILHINTTFESLGAIDYIYL